MLTHKEPGAGATWLARRMARRRNKVFRAPHHTVSLTGLVAELAIAAGGTLYLDEALEFRRSALSQLFAAWRMMHEDARPDLVIRCLVPEGDGGAEQRYGELLERLPAEPRGFCLNNRRVKPWS